MNKHIKSHKTEHLRWNRQSTEKPFKCNVPGCLRSFTAKSSLQSHIKTCHNGSDLSNMLNTPPCQTDGASFEEHVHSSSCGNLSDGSNHLACPFNASQSVNQSSRTDSSNMIPMQPDLGMSQSENNKRKFIESSAYSRAGNTLLDRSSRRSDRNPRDGSVKSIRLNCLHDGCDETFTSQQELRNHIYQSAPGLISEIQFLKSTLLGVLDVMDEWDDLARRDKVRTTSHKYNNSCRR